MHLDWKEKDVKKQVKAGEMTCSFDVFSFTLSVKRLFKCYKEIFGEQGRLDR